MLVTFLHKYVLKNEEKDKIENIHNDILNICGICVLSLHISYDAVFFLMLDTFPYHMKIANDEMKDP